MSVDTIATELFQINQVEAAVHGLDTQQPALTITAQSITSKFFEGLTGIRLECRTTAADANRFHCADGFLTYSYRGHPPVNTTLSFDYAASHDWHVRLQGLDIDLSYFRDLLPGLHPVFRDYQITAGKFHGQLDMRGQDGAVTALKLDSSVQDLSLAGTSTLEKVFADIDLNMADENGIWSTQANIAVTAGSMYLVPGMEILEDRPGFFIEVGAEPLSMQLAAIWEPAEHRLILQELNYTHPGILELQGHAEMIVSDEIMLSAVSLDTRIEKLENTFPVYIQPLILNTDFSNLEIAGGLALAVNYHDQKFEYLDLNFNGIYIDDENDRYSLSRLDGNLAIRSDAEPVQSSLEWDGMSFHRLDFGKGSVIFQSVAGQVDVLRWDNLAVLDGNLEISSFNMKNIGTPDFELTLGARLTPVSMTAFCQAMQWPLLSGTLSGTFQGLTYSHNNLQLNGAVDIQVFDGDVVVRDLSIGDIFSEYSMLSADIEFNGLDLEQLTDTFTFGKIAGTLDGEVNGLVLQNWQPVYFEAAFLTPEDDDKPHRISRKALDNLNSIGGGLSGTMSRGAISLFPEYSYGQIGLSCRLNNNVCELGGVRETDDGFYLLTRGGLLPPWVEVKGTGRSIVWNQLITGLKQIAQGEMRIE